MLEIFTYSFVRVAAYKQSDGKKIDGRRVLVDVERGRTVKGWRPRRLGTYCYQFLINVSPEYSTLFAGGGLGGTRIGSDKANQRSSGR